VSSFKSAYDISEKQGQPHRQPLYFAQYYYFTYFLAINAIIYQ